MGFIVNRLPDAVTRELVAISNDSTRLPLAEPSRSSTVPIFLTIDSLKVATKSLLNDAKVPPSVGIHVVRVGGVLSEFDDADPSVPKE